MVNGHEVTGPGSAEKRRSTRYAMDFFRLFRRDEGGAITVFSIFMILTMLLLGGIGVDLMRHEMVRTQLQATLDRAVLAAADLDQTLDPEDVVADYFAKAGMGDYLTNVTHNEGLNFRNVYAEAEVTLNTTLMHLAGITTLTAPAVGAAEERIAKVEVSMVLDISGSMANNNKMSNLETAANTFIDTVLRGDSNEDVSISLVPYSEHVNAGRDLFDLLYTRRQHNYSHCIEIPDSHFSQASLNQSYRFDQMQHFQWNYDGRNNSLTDTVCPRYDYETITTFSRNATKLKEQVRDFRPRAGTSIFLGMKWGVALLDPSARNLVNGMIGKGKADPVFSARPAAYDDIETLKTVILMTDGKNDRSNRIADRRYDSAGEIEDWNRYNFWYYLYRYVSSYQRSSWYYQKYDAGIGDTLTENICEAAKERGIVIWAIGFEVDDHGADVMRDCASSPSHFFRVEGIEIQDAFEAIARQINQLRLIQ
ncbi:Flp pilus assembly protein TadG [Lutimaribacter pacificus]|uniref:Flp pilus assembly protein TadG n=1 Tax=Lutimaribacter pacificus TaxID=391948 RepID=A0A1H0B9I6_9RHOB|nr:TadE/TadG family type IV pilus assembly protein [Lutimaribacter pacificus]SDN42334.1 Flp pilus assembly protein TadG [Lutimaribacter pacificus]SHJ58786.1 Flp pilus assembly protein TadG [Lutimaribacter pacificus]